MIVNEDGWWGNRKKLECFEYDRENCYVERTQEQINKHIPPEKIVHENFSKEELGKLGLLKIDFISFPSDGIGIF